MTPEKFAAVKAYGQRIADDRYPEGDLILELCEYAKTLESRLVDSRGFRSFAKPAGTP